MIVPREHRKLTVTKDGKIKEETYYVSSRQIPLFDIRQQTLKDHERKGLVCTRPNQQ